MKRRLFKISIVLFAFFIFAFALPNVVHAEEEQEDVVVDNTQEDSTVETPEVDEPTEETETPVEEDVDFRTMLKEFIDQWIIAILAVFGGIGGTAIATVITKGFIGKAKEVISESNEANKESTNAVNKAKEMLVEGLDKIESKIEEFETKYSEGFEFTNEQIRNCIGEIGVLKDANKQFKELVALLVASNPQLASSGYATKILELLDERSGSNE